MKSKTYLYIVMWIATLLVISSIIGSSSKVEIDSWYSALNRSSLTPPNYVFPISWTILYTLIAICGWLIWRDNSYPNYRAIRGLYIGQLVLNWSWTPLFFGYHLTGLSLLILLFMDIIVAITIYLSLSRVRWVSILMMPYFLWILFATYLNYYIWQYN